MITDRSTDINTDV